MDIKTVEDLKKDEYLEIFRSYCKHIKQKELYPKDNPEALDQLYELYTTIGDHSGVFNGIPQFKRAILAYGLAYKQMFPDLTKEKLTYSLQLQIRWVHQLLILTYKKSTLIGGFWGEQDLADLCNSASFMKHLLRTITKDANLAALNNPWPYIFFPPTDYQKNQTWLIKWLIQLALETGLEIPTALFFHKNDLKSMTWKDSEIKLNFLKAHKIVEHMKRNPNQLELATHTRAPSAATSPRKGKLLTFAPEPEEIKPKKLASEEEERRALEEENQPEAESEESKTKAEQIHEEIKEGKEEIEDEPEENERKRDKSEHNTDSHEPEESKSEEINRSSLPEIVRSPKLPVRRTNTCRELLASFEPYLIQGDGNCLFSAIAKSQFDDENRHVEVRTQIVNHVANHPEAFEQFFPDEENRNPSQWCDEMKTPTSSANSNDKRNWGDERCLEAASQLYKSTIFVFSPIEGSESLTSAQVTFYGSYPNCIFLEDTGEHYNLYVPKDSSEKALRGLRLGFIKKSTQVDPHLYLILRCGSSRLYCYPRFKDQKIDYQRLPVITYFDSKKPIKFPPKRIERWSFEEKTEGRDDRKHYHFFSMKLKFKDGTEAFMTYDSQEKVKFTSKPNDDVYAQHVQIESACPEFDQRLIQDQDYLSKHFKTYYDQSSWTGYMFAHHWAAVYTLCVWVFNIVLTFRDNGLLDDNRVQFILGALVLPILVFLGAHVYTYITTNGLTKYGSYYWGKRHASWHWYEYIYLVALVLFLFAWDVFSGSFFLISLKNGEVFSICLETCSQPVAFIVGVIVWGTTLVFIPAISTINFILWMSLFSFIVGRLKGLYPVKNRQMLQNLFTKLQNARSPVDEPDYLGDSKPEEIAFLKGAEPEDEKGDPKISWCKQLAVLDPRLNTESKSWNQTVMIQVYNQVLATIQKRWGLTDKQHQNLMCDQTWFIRNVKDVPTFKEIPEESRQELLDFFNSLLTAPKPITVKEMPSFCTESPVGGEKVIYSLNFLVEKKDGSTPHLYSYLEYLFDVVEPNSWESFLEQVSSDDKTSFESLQKEKKFVRKLNSRMIFLLKVWASSRFQTFSRNVLGQKELQDALYFLANLQAKANSDKIEEDEATGEEPLLDNEIKEEKESQEEKKEGKEEKEDQEKEGQEKEDEEKEGQEKEKKEDKEEKEGQEEKKEEKAEEKADQLGKQKRKAKQDENVDDWFPQKVFFRAGLQNYQLLNNSINLEMLKPRNNKGFSEEQNLTLWLNDLLWLNAPLNKNLQDYPVVSNAFVFCQLTHMLSTLSENQWKPFPIADCESKGSSEKNIELLSKYFNEHPKGGLNADNITEQPIQKLKEFKNALAQISPSLDTPSIQQILFPEYDSFYVRWLNGIAAPDDGLVEEMMDIDRLLRYFHQDGSHKDFLENNSTPNSSVKRFEIVFPTQDPLANRVTTVCKYWSCKDNKFCFDSRPCSGYWGNWAVGQMKAVHQSASLLSFPQNEIIQFLDINQDYHFSQALFIPNLLNKFKDPELGMVGVPNYIFTEKWSWIGYNAAAAERIFTTQTHRYLNFLKIFLFYGHSAFVRRKVVEELGLPMMYVAEDIAFGSLILSYGYKITHVEWLQVGKARDVGLLELSKFLIKIASSSAQYSYSRILNRLSWSYGIMSPVCSLLNWWGTAGFFFSFYVIAWGFLLVLATQILFQIFSQTGILGDVDSTLIEDSLVFSASPLILGAFSSVTLMTQLFLEYGLFNFSKLSYYLSRLPGLTLWYGFNIGNFWRGFYKGRTEAAFYLPSGRGPGLAHEPFAKTYRNFRRSHFYPGFLILTLVVINLILDLNFGFFVLGLYYLFLAITMPIAFAPGFLTNNLPQGHQIEYRKKLSTDLQVYRKNISKRWHKILVRLRNHFIMKFRYPKDIEVGIWDQFTRLCSLIIQSIADSVLLYVLVMSLFYIASFLHKIYQSIFIPADSKINEEQWKKEKFLLLEYEVDEEQEGVFYTGIGVPTQVWQDSFEVTELKEQVSHLSESKTKLEALIESLKEQLKQQKSVTMETIMVKTTTLEEDEELMNEINTFKTEESDQIDHCINTSRLQQLISEIEAKQSRAAATFLWEGVDELVRKFPKKREQSENSYLLLANSKFISTEYNRVALIKKKTIFERWASQGKEECQKLMSMNDLEPYVTKNPVFGVFSLDFTKAGNELPSILQDFSLWVEHCSEIETKAIIYFCIYVLKLKYTYAEAREPAEQFLESIFTRLFTEAPISKRAEALVTQSSKKTALLKKVRKNYKPNESTIKAQVGQWDMDYKTLQTYVANEKTPGLEHLIMLPDLVQFQTLTVEFTLFSEGFKFLSASHARGLAYFFICNNSFSISNTDFCRWTLSLFRFAESAPTKPSAREKNFQLDLLLRKSIPTLSFTSNQVNPSGYRHDDNNSSSVTVNAPKPPTNTTLNNNKNIPAAPPMPSMLLDSQEVTPRNNTLKFPTFSRENLLREIEGFGSPKSSLRRTKKDN